VEYMRKCPDGDEPRIPVNDEFIANNKLSINLEAAKACMEDTHDVFGFGFEVAANFVSFDDASPHLDADYVAEVLAGKKTWTQVTDVKEAVQDFLDYMVFAWMKAFDQRGLSAGRSISKLSAWMKCLDRPDVAEVLNDDSLYPQYGRPALRKACEMLGIKHPDDL